MKQSLIKCQEKEEKTERVLVYLHICPFTEDELNTDNTTPIEFIDQKNNSIICKKSFLSGRNSFASYCCG